VNSNLPPGVTRDRDARQDVTLENCELLKFCLRDERRAFTSINVSRHGPSLVQPEKKLSRLRDVRPGDYVLLEGARSLVTEVVVYR
jgi:hypothetical protein